MKKVSFLEKFSSFSIHHRNIQSLAIEIYKFLHGLSPAIMGDKIRPRQELYSRNPKTVKYGAEIISFLAPKIWAIVPQNIKNCTSLPSFKINIRKWKPDCPCCLCKCFLKHVGFIQKIIKATKRKFAEHKDCYFVLSLVHFGSMFSGS